MCSASELSSWTGEDIEWGRREWDQHCSKEGLGNCHRKTAYPLEEKAGHGKKKKQRNPRSHTSERWRKRKQIRKSRWRSPVFCQTRGCYSVNLSCWLFCTPVIAMNNVALPLATTSWNEQYLLYFWFFQDYSSSVMVFIEFSMSWNKVYVVCRHKTLDSKAKRHILLLDNLFLLPSREIHFWKA